MSAFNELNDAIMKAAKETYVPRLKAELSKQTLVADKLGITQKGDGTIRLAIKE